MKSTVLIIGVLALSSLAWAKSGGPVSDSAMGLSKASVFDDPSPPAFVYPDTKPAAARPLPRAYEGAPPQVPHGIADFLPITADENTCLSCHDKPKLMGKKLKGLATPMPESHYTKVDNKWQLNNNRYVCTQCHVAQANVKDLVGNTFRTR